jgi:hypothetical protein
MVRLLHLVVLKTRKIPRGRSQRDLHGPRHAGTEQEKIMIYLATGKQPPPRATRRMRRIARNEELGRSTTGEKILATGVTVSAILLSLTGGLALVVRQLRYTNLSVSLSLTKGDRSDGDEAAAQPVEQVQDSFRSPSARVNR